MASSHTVGQPMLASTPLPVMGMLLCALHDIIAKATAVKGIPFPPQAPPLIDDLAGKFASPQSSKGDLVWPRFPAVTAYFSGAAAEPLEQKAQVSTFDPITKVDNLTDRGFTLVPPLEPNLSAVFGVRATRHAALFSPGPDHNQTN